MLPRPVLQDIDLNVVTGSTHATYSRPITGENAIVDKLSASHISVTSNRSEYESRDEYLKVCKERDTLVEEVRKLTRQLSKVTEPADQTSSWQKLTASTREVRRIEDEMRDLRSQLIDKEELQRRQADELSSCQAEKSKLTSSLASTKLELSAAQTITSRLLISLDGSKKDVASVTAELEELKKKHGTEVRELKDTVTNLESQVSDMADHIEELICSGGSGSGGFESVPEEQVGSVVDSETVKDLQDKLAKSELLRKKLQNKVHELRGNVRVFVRCRPFLHGDEEYHAAGSAEATAVRCCEEANVISLQAPRGGVSGPQTYSFDQVFQSNSSQEKVFDAVSDLIQSALDGYRVCVFAYGQTGSGKTHTMSGSGSVSGIIPRAVDKMVQEVISMRASGWQIKLKASILEVYNESVRDILTSSMNDPLCEETNTSENKSSAKHRITFSNGKVSVSDLSSVEIDTTTLEEGRRCLDEILSRSQKNRTTASTAMNERSSRSHCLFYLDISGYHAGVNTYMEGGLRLVDLAGSERLGRAGTSGDSSRFRETVSINKSLSTLGEVFLSLANKAPHVPYRNSKLTMLLQDCLSGDGKALMFVNVSPTMASLQETICSLRFANQVNQVELGQAKKTIFKNAFLPPVAPAPVPEKRTMADPGRIKPKSTAEISFTGSSDSRPDNSFGESGDAPVRSKSEYSRSTAASNSRASILVCGKRPATTVASCTDNPIASTKRKKIVVEKKSSCWR